MKHSKLKIQFNKKKKCCNNLRFKIEKCHCKMKMNRHEREMKEVTEIESGEKVEIKIRIKKKNNDINDGSFIDNEKNRS